MTQEDIIRMAREAELHSVELLDLYGGNVKDSELAKLRGLIRFAALVAAAERDRICKQIAQLHDALSMASSSNQIKGNP